LISQANALPPGAHTTYAQSGEDVVMYILARSLNTPQPSYLDIGAADPIQLSNTYFLYLAGGRGVLVEPNPAYGNQIRKVRPEDKLLPAGIGISDATEADYYMFNGDGLNTFDPEQAQLVTKRPEIKLEKVIKMPLVNINRAISENFGGNCPDIVSIDIEGLDLPVLKTLDFTKYRPKIVCAETLITHSSKHNPETTPFMISKGYEVRGMTFANTIYVDSKILQ